MSLVFPNPALHVGDFLHHVPGDEAVGNLVALRQRVVEHPPFQGFQHLRLRQVAEGFHVGQVHAAVQVEHDELIVVGVQVAAQQGVFLVVLRFVDVEPLVGVTQVDVQLCLLRLHPLHVERL